MNLVFLPFATLALFSSSSAPLPADIVWTSGSVILASAIASPESAPTDKQDLLTSKNGVQGAPAVDTAVKKPGVSKKKGKKGTEKKKHKKKKHKKKKGKGKGKGKGGKGKGGKKGIPTKKLKE